MGKYWIFLIALGVAAANGVEVPAWAWIITVVLAFIGSMGVIVKAINEARK